MQRWAVTCKQCHGTAFVVTGDLPKPSEVVRASRCEHLDGRPLEGKEALCCDTCGADFVHTGVEPSDQWTLLPDVFEQPHDPNDAPFGHAADPVDIARVRMAIASATRPKTAQRRPRASPRHSG